jgi:cell division protein FtsQ
VVARLLPSGRSLLGAFALIALAAGGYAAARTTAAFAVTTIEVRGAPPAVAAQVRSALAPLLGRTLVTLKPADVENRLSPIPDVAAATYDRAFPHTLVVEVEAERPLAVLRQGADSWLLSARGRVLRRLPRGARPRLARVWIDRAVDVAVGESVAHPIAARALRVLARVAAQRLPTRVRTVRADGELVLVLASGLELRLGDETELPLKLAVAAEILRPLDGRHDLATAYLDVSVVERPVSGSTLNSPVESETPVADTTEESH